MWLILLRRNGHATSLPGEAERIELYVTRDAAMARLEAVAKQDYGLTFALARIVGEYRPLSGYEYVETEGKQ